MEAHHIAGLAACIVRRDGVAWMNAYGYADLERHIPMTPDALQNICSISKTFTTTALMQEWEAGRFQLDDDVSDHLGFALRNPAHPDAPITFRHLLTHVSSIKDGEWYARMYQCGDPKVALGDWIVGYLKPGGAYYDAADNFHPWAPGERWEYNNVAFGVLAYAVERMTGTPFAQYCRSRIFEPLGMDETSWYLADIDISRHVVPYTWSEGGHVLSPTWGGRPLGVIREGVGAVVPEGDGHHASCPYNHPNFPDGFLRTSVRQLARYARAYLNGGVLDGQRVLREGTILEMFQDNGVNEQRPQGLDWYGEGTVRGQVLWGHGGSDPGINTDIRLLPDEGLAAIVFTNTWGARAAEITTHLLEEAPNL
jgi:CubicO group peptidase (beta-lactamase class C family)